MRLRGFGLVDAFCFAIATLSRPKPCSYNHLHRGCHAPAPSPQFAASASACAHRCAWCLGSARQLCLEGAASKKCRKLLPAGLAEGDGGLWPGLLYLPAPTLALQVAGKLRACHTCPFAKFHMLSAHPCGVAAALFIELYSRCSAFHPNLLSLASTQQHSPPRWGSCGLRHRRKGGGAWPAARLHA